MPSTISSEERSTSVSSMRSTSTPPRRRASSQLNSAVRAPPTWRYPVGDGAKRTRIIWSLSVLGPGITNDRAHGDQARGGLTRVSSSADELQPAQSWNATARRYDDRVRCGPPRFARQEGGDTVSRDRAAAVRQK